MKKFLLSGSFAIAALAVSLTLHGQAVAADMSAAPVYAKAPASTPAYDWSGFYVGASLGGRWDESTWTTTSLGFPGAPGVFPPATGNNPTKFSSTSGRYGGYLGYNWQVAPTWVVGVEGDAAWAKNTSQISGIPGTFNAPFPTGDYAARTDKWDAGVRARLGFLVSPTMMLFGTAGASWLNSEATAACGTPQLWCTGTNNTNRRVDTVSKTLLGWTVGGGAEWMLSSNWLVRGEYRYASYQGYSARLLAGGGTQFGSDLLDASLSGIHTHTALFGVAYKFGGPVVARY